MIDYLKLAYKRIKRKNIFDPFPPHKVTLKTIYISSPRVALAYLVNSYRDIRIRVLKQYTRSVIIEICCSEDTYEDMKLHFVKDMGDDFLWKD